MLQKHIDITLSIQMTSTKRNDSSFSDVTGKFSYENSTRILSAKLHVNTHTLIITFVLGDYIYFRHEFHLWFRRQCVLYLFSGNNESSRAFHFCMQKIIFSHDFELIKLRIRKVTKNSTHRI